MIELLEAVASSSIISGLIGGLITGVLAFSGGIFQRSHDRRLSRFDRVFEVKLERYDAYSKAVAEIVRSIEQMHAQGDPHAFGPFQNAEVPRSVVNAYHDLQVVAPLDIRNGALDQFGVMQSAMEGNADKLGLLNSMNNDLVIRMQYDIDLTNEGFVVRQIVRVRRQLHKLKARRKDGAKPVASTSTSHAKSLDLPEVDAIANESNQKI